MTCPMRLAKDRKHIDFAFYWCPTHRMLVCDPILQKCFSTLQLRLSNSRKLPPRPHRTTINRNSLSIDVRACPTRKIDDRTGDVLGHTQSSHRVALRNGLDAARHGQKTVGHLAGEEARADRVDGDVSGAQLDG